MSELPASVGWYVKKYGYRIDTCLFRVMDEYAAHVTAEQVKPLVAALRKAKAFHDRDEGCNGFTAEYETLRLMIDQALKQFGEG